MTQNTNTLNGLNVDNFQATVAAITEQPVVAKFQFRAENEWLSAGHNRTTVTDFDGACETHEHEKPHVMDNDEPAVLLSTDKAANPGVFALHALAGCICSALVYHATARGITIHSVESKLYGDVDLRGFLGMDEKVRNGFTDVRVVVKVNADASPEVLDELVELARDRSPLCDIIANPTPLTVERAA